jgi:hypothetical protein
MENARNNKGHFVKGHSGFKPKGAVSKANKQYLQHIQWVSELLEENIEENIKNLKPKERVGLYLDLLKYVYLKKKRIQVDTVPSDKAMNKITLRIVHSE